MKLTAARMGVGEGNTLGLVAKRKKPAATIGNTSMLLPVAQPSMACSNQRKAGVCCGWSVREAASSTLRSGVTIGRVEQGAIGERVDARREPASAAINGQRLLLSCAR